MKKVHKKSLSKLLGEDVAYLTKLFEDKAKALQLNPHHFFIWETDGCMEHASLLSLEQEILEMLEKVEPANIKKWLQKKVHNAARYLHNSTSQSSNRMHITDMQAASKMVELFENSGY